MILRAVAAPRQPVLAMQAEIPFEILDATREIVLQLTHGRGTGL
jgi:hypothetical protein